MRRLAIFLGATILLLSCLSPLEAGRYYDPELARWTTPDPALNSQTPNALLKLHQGKLLWVSPYSYSFDNPLRYVDPDGRLPWDIVDIGIAALSVKDFLEHPSLKTGFYAGLDVLAAAAPVIPAPGYVRHGAKLLEKFDDIVDFVKATDKGGDAFKLTKNAEDAITVYRSIDEAGNVQYIGITKNFERRAAEHLRGKGIEIRQIPGLSGLSKTDARAVEQALIEFYGLGKEGGTLLNKINSIAKKNPNYAKQLQRGIEILKQINYPGF